MKKGTSTTSSSCRTLSSKRILFVGLVGCIVSQVQAFVSTKPTWFISQQHEHQQRIISKQVLLHAKRSLSSTTLLRISPIRDWSFSSAAAAAAQRQRSQERVAPDQVQGTIRTPNEVQDTTSSNSTGGASVPTLSVSLVKSIVGGGVLALPSGFAALGGSPDIVPQAVATIAACGALNAFYFRLMGKVCDETDAASYQQAWERTVGKATSPLVTAVVTLKTGLACLAYSMILADSGQALAQAAGWTDITRTEALLAVTCTVLVPLTLRRDFKSLAPFSLFGLFGVLLTTGTVVTRYRDGSYLPETGMFVHDLPTQLQPSFVDAAATTTSAVATSSSEVANALASTGAAAAADAAVTASTMGWPGVVLACTLATAFVAHYNAPRFYNELQDSSVEKFQTVTFASYGVAAVLFVIVGVCGFLTFGQASQGYILNNYSPMDPLATLSKTALTCSIVMTFPLPFVGLRDGLLDLLKVSDREEVHGVTTVALLALITAGALSVHDLALVLSVGGGTFSTAVSAVFPVLMFFSMDSDNKALWEQVLAAVGMVLSVGIGITGVNLALAKAAAAAAAVST